MQVKIGELKDRLSHYLRLVRRGQTVLVADRDQVVARIEPVRDIVAADGDDAAFTAALVAGGVARPPARRLPKGFFDARPALRADVVDALLADRDEGR